MSQGKVLDLNFSIEKVQNTESTKKRDVKAEVKVQESQIKKNTVKDIFIEDDIQAEDISCISISSTEKY